MTSTEPPTAYLPSFSHSDSCDRYYAADADGTVTCTCGADKAQAWLDALVADRDRLAEERDRIPARAAETVLRNLWADIHPLRFAHERGDVGGPDSFYNGVLHAERVIERALGFRPGSVDSDPLERLRLAVGGPLAGDRTPPRHG